MSIINKQKTMRSFTFLVLLFFSATVFSQSFAESEKTKIWQDFREKYPNPYQTVGFAQFADSSQLYLISEPPQFVNLDDITGIFGGTDYSVEVKTHEIGFDGWVKDILICVHRPADIYKSLFIMQLNNLLFFNSYKPMYMDLPVNRPRQLFIENNLDYNISAMELNKWFVESNMQFSEVENPKIRYSFREFLNIPKAGVYISSDSAFVAWNIPSGNLDGLSRKNISKFAIESDVILGAISNSRTLTVIGRGRQCSYDELPPLRIETVEMLSGTQDGRFMQSLNIAGLVTGKLNSGADWCPAFISDELENDEFGHVLTLTDILLKDWIEAGMLDYPQYNYPKPDHYPFENGLQKGNVRYEWNTEDYIFSTQINNNRFISLRNTACLNISLFDNNDAEEHEFEMDVNRKANEYFVKMQNADVARVAQYTALYALFKANGVQNPNYSKPYTRDKTTLMLHDAHEILSGLRNLSNGEITDISRKIAIDDYDEYGYLDLHLSEMEARDEWAKQNEAAARNAARQLNIEFDVFVKTPEFQAQRAEHLKRFEEQLYEWIDQTKEQIISDKNKETSEKIIALRDKLAEIDDEDFEKLCFYTANPNGHFSGEFDEIRLLSREVAKLYFPVWNYGKHFGISIDQVKSNYVESLADDHGRWLKTPKIVVTDNKRSRMLLSENRFVNVGTAIGGHTLTTDVIIDKTADFTEETREAITVVDRNVSQPAKDVIPVNLQQQVIIIQPLNGSIFDGNQIKVDFEITGTVPNFVKILIDNKPVQLLNNIKLGQNSAIVNVPERDCRIVIIAQNDVETSAPAVVNLTRNEYIFKPTLYLLAIGVSDYTDPTLRLDFSAKDASDFAKSMLRQEGLLYDKVVLKLLTDDAANAENIRDELQWLQAETTHRDVAMLYMAGHGVNNNIGDFYFMPVNADMNRINATCVGYTEIKSIVNAVAGKMLLFMDACHSGNVLGNSQRRAAMVSQAVSDLTGTENGSIIFTSSTGRQYSLEASEWNNGAFTKALVEGLNGKADLFNRQIITVKSLDSYIANRVKDLTKGQQAPTTIIPNSIPDFPIALVTE